MKTSKQGEAYRSYSWLAAGFVLHVFSNGVNHMIPLASWLAPVFLLRFLRTQSKLKGSLILLPAYILGWIIMLNGMYYEGMPGWVSIVTAFVYAILFYLPFLADRLMLPRIRGILSTLAFPLAWVSIEFMLSSLFYTGSWFSLAYTQRDNLALIQLVSITGIVGVSFMMTWFASVVNWTWENNLSLPIIRKGISLYIGILALVLLSGGAYMTFLPADSDTVRVAAITRSFDIDLEVERIKGTVLEEEYENAIQKMLARSLDEFLQDSQQAVYAGAKIIVWQENGVAVKRADETSFIQQGRSFAMRESVYLVMGLKMSAEEKPLDENKAILIDHSGNVSEYLKNHRSPNDFHILGDGKVLIRESDYGKIATLICKDFEYPRFVRQAGKADVDIMLIPSQNWEGITPYHARIANFRAIENGCSMITAAYHGLSTAVDYHGNVLSRMNDFTTEDRIMIADIPTRGIKTIYSIIGDSFAWLCLLAFLTLIWVNFGENSKE